MRTRPGLCTVLSLISTIGGTCIHKDIPSIHHETKPLPPPIHVCFDETRKSIQATFPYDYFPDWSNIDVGFRPFSENGCITEIIKIRGDGAIKNDCPDQCKVIQKSIQAVIEIEIGQFFVTTEIKCGPIGVLIGTPQYGITQFNPPLPFCQSDQSSDNNTGP